MFGTIWYRSKVLRVLQDEFDYKPAIPGWQKETLNGVTRHIKARGGNEYDGAIAFMLVTITAMSGADGEARAFMREKQDIAARLMPRARLAPS
jgi:hypothetical protein